LKAVLSSLPPKTDKAIAPAWLGLLGNALIAYKDADPQACAGELGKVWKAVWAFLESSDATIRKASCQSLILLAQCFTPELKIRAMQEHGKSEPKSALGKIVLQTEKAFESLAFVRSMSELLLVISALISNLHYREIPAGPTAAEVLLLPLVQRIGNMRTERNFEHKEAADRVVSQAMGTMGPAVLLGALPLNLEPADRSVRLKLLHVPLAHLPVVNISQAGREPRAFLLPLLAQPHPSPLLHFVSYFVPLSERMFNLQQNAESENRQSEAKMWTVLIAQIWAGFPYYCWSKADVEEVSETFNFSAFSADLCAYHAGFRFCICANAFTNIIHSSRITVLRSKSVENSCRLQCGNCFARPDPFGETPFRSPCRHHFSGTGS